MPHLENFFLGDDFIEAVAGSSGRVDELKATLDAMGQLGIDRTPYADFCITVREATFDRVSGFLGAINPAGSTPPDDALVRLTFTGANDGLSNIPMVGATVSIENIHGLRVTNILGDIEDKKEGAPKEKYHSLLATQEGVLMVSTYLSCALVVGLAMRGVSKNRKAEKKSKLEKLGIGKPRPSSPYGYTTTLSLIESEVEEDDTGDAPTGLPKRPHLRRGHIRSQHYGPGNQLIKRIFVEPVFVNSDKEAVASARERYNVSAGNSAHHISR